MHLNLSPVRSSNVYNIPTILNFLIRITYQIEPNINHANRQHET